MIVCEQGICFNCVNKYHPKTLTRGSFLFVKFLASCRSYLDKMLIIILIFFQIFSNLSSPIFLYNVWSSEGIQDYCCGMGFGLSGRNSLCCILKNPLRSPS